MQQRWCVRGIFLFGRGALVVNFYFLRLSPGMTSFSLLVMDWRGFFWYWLVCLTASFVGVLFFALRVLFVPWPSHFLFLPAVDFGVHGKFLEIFGILEISAA